MKQCKQCDGQFEVSYSDKIFYEKISPVFGDKKYAFPTPEHCPNCRQIRRLLFRNERNLYRRNCDLCGVSMISMYASDKPYIIYCQKCWWGDGWDPLDYGKDFDFNRSFFDQFSDLLQAVPHANLLNFETDNCDYANFCNESQNCYLCFGSGFMEDCQYLDWVYYAKNSFDCSYSQKSERDYMNVDCSQTYHSKFLYDCHNVSDSLYSIDCRNCKNCFGCVGLRNKEYYLFNKPCSPEEYERLTNQLRGPKYLQKIHEEVAKLKSAHPHLANRILASENCTGNDLENCKNCFDSYGVKDSQDCRFNFDTLQMKDSYDCNRAGMNELAYQSVAGGYNNDAQFFALSMGLHAARYAYECMHSKNIFGSVGLKHKDYVILNKQYNKEDFNSLVSKIVEHMNRTGEWGQFFPPALSPFGYNETVANEFFPMDEGQTVALGFQWRSMDKKEYLPAQKDLLACEVTGRNFKLTPQEIKFYETEGLPTPLRHPNQRYLDRLSLKLPRILYDRQCLQCQAAIKTPYSPERPEIVYCEECYLKEIY